MNPFDDDESPSDAGLAAAPSDGRARVLSVSELTDEVKGLLEASFPAVWVSGEISNFSRPSSGHCYFTLKDERAQLRAVVWRGAVSKLKFNMHDGMEVICFGGLDLYPPRGSYQLVVSKMEPKGIGALELALRQLRDKLAAEGLFDPDRKRPLPKFPRRIAFVTSPTGAAVRDFLEVMKRRWSGADVLIVPTRVQGDGAAREIAAGIELVNRLATPVDVIVVGRGGGSLEDLWCFNEEPVVRAVAASRIPTVSAVGHEIDVTLCDLAADVRALTPSEAAELIVPAQEAIVAAIRDRTERMTAALRNKALSARQRLTQLAERRCFRKPHELLHERAQRLDELWSRAGRGFKFRLERERERLQARAAQLQSLSPLGVLARGYSLTQLAADDGLVRDAAQLQVGDVVRTRFAQGETLSRVEEIRTT